MTNTYTTKPLEPEFDPEKHVPRAVVEEKYQQVKHLLTPAVSGVFKMALDGKFFMRREYVDRMVAVARKQNRRWRA